MPNIQTQPPHPDSELPALVALLDSRRPTAAVPVADSRTPAIQKVALKLAMLYEGQCAGLGATQAAAKFGYSRQAYHQVLKNFHQLGVGAFFRRRGPKTNYRRSPEVIRAVVHHRLQHPQASVAELARSLWSRGFRIGTRTVERIITELGLQRGNHWETGAPVRRQRSVSSNLPPPLADSAAEASSELGRSESACARNRAG